MTAVRRSLLLIPKTRLSTLSVAVHPPPLKSGRGPVPIESARESYSLEVFNRRPVEGVSFGILRKLAELHEAVNDGDGK